jgi:hypothetical protein
LTAFSLTLDFPPSEFLVQALFLLASLPDVIPLMWLAILSEFY